jgi:hypothetical protein
MAEGSMYAFTAERGFPLMLFAHVFMKVGDTIESYTESVGTNGHGG